MSDPDDDLPRPKLAHDQPAPGEEEPLPEQATPTPHDAIFKAILAEPENLRALLSAVLPAELVSAMDWGSVEMIAGNTIDSALVERHTDLEIRARVGETDASIFVMVEHRSTRDPTLPLRGLRYLVRRWEQLEAADVTEASGLRPPIVFIVLSHARAGWDVPAAFEDTVDLRGPLASLGPFVPRFQYIVVDVTRLTDAELSRWSLPPALDVLLRLFRDGRRRSIVDVLREALASLVTLLGRRRLDLVEKLLRYAAGLTPEHERAEFRKVTETLASSTEDPHMRTVADVLYEEAFEKGIEKGAIDARRRSLRRLLRLKFGGVSPEASARIESATSETLEAWTDRVLTVATVEDVLSE